MMQKAIDPFSKTADKHAHILSDVSWECQYRVSKLVKVMIRYLFLYMPVYVSYPTNTLHEWKIKSTLNLHIKVTNRIDPIPKNRQVFQEGIILYYPLFITQCFYRILDRCLPALPAHRN
jgi:hypothetical protein